MAIPRGFLSSPETARHIPSAGGYLLASAMDTGEHVTLIRSCAPPGDSTPLHGHPNMDESFYVLRGSYTIACGDDEFEAGPGDFVHLPRGLPNKHVAGPAGGEMLTLAHPVGLERFFNDMDAGDDGSPRVGTEARHLVPQLTPGESRSSPAPALSGRVRHREARGRGLTLVRGHADSSIGWGNEIMNHG